MLTTSGGRRPRQELCLFSNREYVLLQQKYRLPPFLALLHYVWGAKMLLVFWQNGDSEKRIGDDLSPSNITASVMISFNRYIYYWYCCCCYVCSYLPLLCILLVLLPTAYHVWQVTLGMKPPYYGKETPKKSSSVHPPSMRDNLGVVTYYRPYQDMKTFVFRAIRK